MYRKLIFIFIGTFWVGAESWVGRLAWSASPSSWAVLSAPADWVDWVQTRWNSHLETGEIVVEAQWVSLPGCLVTTDAPPLDAEEFILHRLGEFTVAERVALPGAVTTDTYSAVRYITDVLEADPGTVRASLDDERRVLADTIQKADLRLLGVTRTEIAYALMRVGIWQKNRCEYFVLSTVEED